MASCLIKHVCSFLNYTDYAGVPSIIVHVDVPIILLMPTLFLCPQLFTLEERRRACLEDLATLIQKIYRGWKCRTHFLLLKKSQVVVAAWYRRYAVS